MGLILDSSVLISAERQGQNARQMLAAIARTEGETEIALSVVTLWRMVRLAPTQRNENKIASSSFRSY